MLVIAFRRRRAFFGAAGGGEPAGRMHLDIFIQVMMSGIAIGLLYALPALAIVMLFNTAGFFNLAQGEFLALSTYFLYQTHMLWGMPLVPSIIITIAILGVIGVLVNKLLFNVLRKFKAKELLILIATIALSVFLKNAIRAVWGTKPLAMTGMFPTQPFNIFGAYVMPSAFWIMGASFILIVVLYLLSQKSVFGIAMRAASFDREAASLMGMKVNTIIGASFAISLMVTAVAGILSTSTLYLIPEMGDSVAIKSFAATVVGGFGNPAGAVIGGLLIGVVESFVSLTLPASYKNAITFVILIVFLLFKPSGIFKTQIVNKV